MKKICVFTGAATGNNPVFRETATKTGEMLAARGLGLVYGGGKMGLMGAVANGTIAGNGHVTGIIPQFLNNIEIGHPDVKDLHIVDSMHERKAMMYDISSAFIILPGGLGTLDETMEVITWRQLKQHSKPIIILNQNGYWDHLLALFQSVIDNEFMHNDHIEHFEVAQNLDELVYHLDKLA